MPATDARPITRALISVSDKSELTGLGQFLEGRGIEILSTGGSAAALREGGIAVRDVADYTGFPEMMDGRVKTLHPNIHGGILALRSSIAHTQAMADHGISPIDLVVVNLYPFEDTVAGGADAATCIENIDIGGPALIRAAAKNHAFVTVVVDPIDYPALRNDLEANDGATSLDLRRRLAAKAFSHTAAYDAAISGWFGEQGGERFPERLAVPARRRSRLRYGENPHQDAALYADGTSRPGAATACLLQGKELSYNNLNDTDAAFELIAEFESPAAAIIKHANPCGVALGATPAEAYRKALACDPVSAFGGVVALNRALDEEAAREITKLFAEVVIAPGIDEAAQAVLATKRNLRALVAEALPDPAAPGLILKSIAGGYLVQDRDHGGAQPRDVRVVTKREPDARERADLAFAFTVAKHVKSNAIVYAKEGATVGIGAGQMSRVDAARIAALKAREAAKGLAEPRTIGSVVASDAFFPFADGLLAAAAAGATAVIQPGGSRRDDEVIAAADENGLAMMFTGLRHFRH